MTTGGSDVSRPRLSRANLRSVSRSFYLSIRLLPGKAPAIRLPSLTCWREPPTPLRTRRKSALPCGWKNLRNWPALFKEGPGRSGEFLQFVRRAARG